MLLAAILVPAGWKAVAADPATQAPRPDAADSLNRLAEEYLKINRAEEAEGTFPIRDATSLQERYRSQDLLIERLKLIDPAGLSQALRTEYSILEERVESQRGLRICHAERWDLNHITGWQVRLPPQVASQSTASAADRERALRRWGSLPAYIEADIRNLKMGLASGYSVPQSVVMRVLRQVDALAAAMRSPEGPFDAPASHSTDAAFQRQWRALMATTIVPSIQHFAEFLRNHYLPHARASIGLWNLPDGGQCYAALLRRETTLDVSADATYDLGRSTVRQSTAELKDMGAKLFGTSNVKEILKGVKNAPANRFDSPEAIVTYANQVLARSISMGAPYFLKLPEQALEIEPLPAYQQGSGISSHYEAADSLNRAAVYRINLDRWQEQRRGAIAVTAVHEGVPGHHLQREAARSSSLAKAITQLAYNSAYVEGWANYAERLSEEIGVYDTPYSAMFRRAVLGQSLIIDPAIHVKRWDRAHARAYLTALGESGQEADELIDRIAVQPAQLTSYEYGGLEILRLRERAKRALGARFDVREFHRRILANGAVPLMTLRREIEEWVTSAGAE
jgi:uncharacterized protein (DUF885 family)